MANRTLDPFAPQFLAGHLNPWEYDRPASQKWLENPDPGWVDGCVVPPQGYLNYDQVNAVRTAYGYPPVLSTNGDYSPLGPLMAPAVPNMPDETPIAFDPPEEVPAPENEDPYTENDDCYVKMVTVTLTYIPAQTVNARSTKPPSKATTPCTCFAKST